MVKRGHFDLANGIFRISKPGVDVDSAGPNDYLLHESHIYYQPYWTNFVACPFAGSTSTSEMQQSVNVTVPNVTADPIILIYPAINPSGNAFPHTRSQGTTSPGGIGNIDLWIIEARATSSTNIEVRFWKASGTAKPPRGAYITLMRKPS